MGRFQEKARAELDRAARDGHHLDAERIASGLSAMLPLAGVHARRGPVFDAHLARPREDAGACLNATMSSRLSTAERAGHRRPGGHAAGAGHQSFQYTIDVSSRFDDLAQFANVVVKTGTARDLTPLRDVGRVELGAQTYSQVFNLNGKQAAGLAIFQTPGANALDVAREVDAKMKTLAREFPQGMVYTIPFDTTHLRAAGDQRSLQDAVRSGDPGADRHPGVPAGLARHAGARHHGAGDDHRRLRRDGGARLLVNLSTLFAIVLAIGIVVDDAIVVVEGAAHHIEKGMSGHDAAIAAMNALMGPIIGITLVLMAVFLPASFLPGLTGQMYAQFALVIAATALISAINAATLKPTQCALWLRRPVPPEQRNFFYRGFNALYGRVENRYASLIGSMVQHSGLMVLIALAIIGAAVYGMSRVATGFLPIEDQGYLLAAVQLPDGASLGRTQKSLQQVEGIAKQSPGRRACHHHRRCFGARQQRLARQCRRRLHHAEGLERARQRRGPRCRSTRLSTTSSPRSRTAASLFCRRRRYRASAMPAASPCRSSCATAVSISSSWDARRMPW